MVQLYHKSLHFNTNHRLISPFQPTVVLKCCTENYRSVVHIISSCFAVRFYTDVFYILFSVKYYCNICGNRHIKISYLSLPYSSSETASSHSLKVSSPATSIARCENHESEAAPCQCFTSGGMFITLPEVISTASLPHS